MGTRNLTCVVLKDEIRVAQYCQWDGYLRGQGKDIIDFIAKELDLRKFKKAISQCQLLTQAQINARYKEIGVEGNCLTDEDVKKMKEKFPSFSRDTGAQLLHLIQEKGIRDVIDNLSFAADSLFCEYAYVLNLDNKTLEIYKGFQKSDPLPNERFYFLTQYTKNKEYKPIRLVHVFSFKDIKKKSFEELEVEFNEKINSKVAA